MSHFRFDPTTGAIPMTFRVSKNFDQTVALPPIERFKFYPEDMLIADDVLCDYRKRSRRLFRKTRGQGAERKVLVTYDGHLVVYMEASRGFVLDMKKARSLASCKAPILYGRTRTILTIKFPFGKLFLYLRGPNALEWMCVLQGVNLDLAINPAAISRASSVCSEDSYRVNYTPSLSAIPFDLEDLPSECLPPPSWILAHQFALAPIQEATKSDEEVPCQLDCQKPPQTPRSFSIRLSTTLKERSLPEEEKKKEEAQGTVATRIQQLEQKTQQGFEKKRKIVLPAGGTVKQTTQYQ